MPDAPPPRRIAWDACVLLHYVNGAEDWLADLDGILDAARRGAFELVTASISRVEVAFGVSEQQQGLLDPTMEEEIDALWLPPSPIKIVELNPVIALEARSLIRAGVPIGWTGLKAADAIHLATAKYMGVEALHTTETKKLPRYAELCGFKIGPPLAEQPQLPIPE